MPLIYSDAIYYNTIIDVLEENEKLTFNKLYKEWLSILRQSKNQFGKHRKKRNKRKHSKLTRYTPSKTKFSEIIKKMVQYNYLKKVEYESSKRKYKDTYYFLTDNSRRLLQMNILRMDDKQLQFRRIYEEFFTIPDFFQSINKKVLEEDPYDELYEKIPLSERIAKWLAFSTDQDFNSFLVSLDLKEEDLEWGTASYGGTSSIIAGILYPSNISSSHLVERKKQYWNEKNHLTKTKEDLMLICVPRNESIGDPDFWIKRIEEWNIEKKGRYGIISKLKSREYVVFIPGVTEEDILVKNEGLLLPSNLREALDILRGFGLVEAKLFGREIRYIISDKQLNDFVASIKTSFITEIDYLLTKWEWFEIPTPGEKERMESIFGKNEFSSISTSLEIKLSEHKKDMRKCKNIDEYFQLINGRSNMYEKLAADITFEVYKESRTVIPVTKQDHLKDVKRYHQYLRNKLVSNLDNLIMNYDEEGIEELKMDFEEIIAKYSFLHDILNNLCPKVFEPPNKELQEDIKNREASRQLAAQEFAKQMNTITPSSMESNRRIIKHIDYVQGKNGKVQPVLNLDKLLDEQVTEENDSS